MQGITPQPQSHPAPPAIRLEGVSKTFRAEGKALPVLEAIDLAVHEGEFISIIGPSGCGKSTLLNIIAGLEEPTTGTIWLQGGRADHRLGTLAYMQQKDLLLPWRTVVENAALGLELQGVPQKEARQRALALIEPFGLQGFEGQYPHALSGGMRQRVAFLRTVLAGKPVILLDEPFGALDALTRANMQAWLLGLWDSLHKTILLITHDVEEALLLSDRIYVLTARPGRVKLLFPTELPRPRRYEMVTTQVFTQMKTALLAALWQDSLREGLKV